MIRDCTLEFLDAEIRTLPQGGLERRCRPQGAVLDSPKVRFTGLAVQAGYGGAKVKGRKRFQLVDTLGHVPHMKVLPAGAPERAGAKELLDEVLTSSTRLQRL